jgi:hypothetical protein
MWKLNLGYGSLVVSVNGLIFSHNSCHLMFNFEKVQLILACKLHSSLKWFAKKIQTLHLFNVVGVVLEKPLKLLFVKSQLIKKGDIICHKRGLQS